MIAQTTTLAGLAAPKSEAARWGYTLALMILGSLVLWVSAKVHVPFYPVPQTLQSLAVLTIGAAFGWRLGAATVLLYLAEGALGLPVFSGTPERGIGLAYMAGPTGGYLLGYLVAAGLAGAPAAGRGLIGRGLAILAGLAVVYAAGIAWLALFIPADRLVAAGIAPFLAGDLVKIGIVALAAPLLAGPARRLLDRRA